MNTPPASPGGIRTGGTLPSVLLRFKHMFIEVQKDTLWGPEMGAESLWNACTGATCRISKLSVESH